MRRMDGSIFQEVSILTTPQRGIVWITKNVLETESAQGLFEAKLVPGSFIPQQTLQPDADWRHNGNCLGANFYRNRQTSDDIPIALYL